MSRLLACEPEGQCASGWCRMTGLQWAVERPPGALIVVQPVEWNDSEAVA